MATLDTLTISDDPAASTLKIAVVGCGHGELDTIYARLESQCGAKGWTLSDIDFLIICGDFQAVRNDLDLNCMSVPRRYLRMGDFHKYYSGAAKAPVLTLVIGGNHEASNYLFELYHGGWLAPNIYYLGAAGVINYGPCRIAGLSGIYNASDYRKPHEERLPYDRDLIRSIYHVREYDVQKLLQVTQPVYIALSHDWPTWVELFGNHEQLFAEKPHFFASAKIDNLGSKPAAKVLNQLRPSYWFSGHMHARFEATVEHRGLKMEDSVKQLDLPDTLKDVLPLFKSRRGPSQEVSQSSDKNQQTKFLALSKVGQDIASYMELKELEVPTRPTGGHAEITNEGKFHLSYDAEWLAITRAYDDALRIPDPETLIVPPLKGKQKSPASSVPKHKNWVKENIIDKGLLRIPNNFAKHAPEYDPNIGQRREQPLEYPNHQTAEFAKLLGISNKFHLEDSI
ncbi:DBR1 domain-containing protein [Fusarium sp. Ph1]|nr:DBR1 domain-containing protein [Fusarium sp. Ph1]